MCSTPAPASRTHSFLQTRRKPRKKFAGEGGGNRPPVLPTNAPNHLSAQQRVPMRREPTLSIFKAVGQGCLQRTRHRSRPQRPPESAASGARGAKRKPCFRQKATPAAQAGEIRVEQMLLHPHGWTGGPGPRARPCQGHGEAPRPATGQSQSASVPRVTPKANGVFLGFIPPARIPPATSVCLNPGHGCQEGSELAAEERGACFQLPNVHGPPSSRAQSGEDPGTMLSGDPGRGTSGDPPLAACPPFPGQKANTSCWGLISLIACEEPSPIHSSGAPPPPQKPT